MQHKRKPYGNFLNRILPGSRLPPESSDSGEIFIRAVRSCPLPIMLHAEDGQIIHVSDSWQALTGYGTDELRTITDWTRRAYGADWEKVSAHILSLHSLSDSVVEGHYKVKTKDNRTIIWEFSSSPLGKLPDGRRYSMSIAVDQTESVKNEHELNLVKRALDCATNSVLITDREGIILYANEAVARTSGHSLKDVIGKKPSVFKSGLHKEDFYRNMWQTLLKGKSFICEMTNRHKEGFLFHEEAMITPILSNNRAVTHFIAIKIDLTEKNELQNELYHALDKAVEASQAKSRLLARVSHELRTPMNGIMGMNQLLQLSQLDEDQKEMTRTIESCSRSMMTIIEDLLSVTALEAKNIQIEKQPFNLQGAMNRRMRQWSQMAQARNLFLSLRIDEAVPEEVEGDEHRIFQILSNLVLNSIKFSNSGNICIEVDQVAELGMRRTRFCISDEGIGVPESFRPYLFEPFRQAEESSTRRYGGLGLGLAIAQHLTRAMGGELVYEPKSDCGSKFFFTLDLAEQDERLPKASRPEQDSSTKRSEYRILLVEDSWDNQIVICRMLRHLGYSVSCAYNGREALDQLAAAPLDLVLLDCHMPVMDGLEAARAIRNGDDLMDPRTQAIPLVGLTADVQEGFSLQCIEAGMDDFLAKPVSLDALEQILIKWLNRPSPKAATDAPSTDFPSLP